MVFFLQVLFLKLQVFVGFETKHFWLEPTLECAGSQDNSQLSKHAHSSYPVHRWGVDARGPRTCVNTPYALDWCMCV